MISIPMVACVADLGRKPADPSPGGMHAAAAVKLGSGEK
jgi:hypothetical protein